VAHALRIDPSVDATNEEDGAASDDAGDGGDGSMGGSAGGGAGGGAAVAPLGSEAVRRHWEHSDGHDCDFDLLSGMVSLK
jgi:hypothetical protein